MLHSNFDTNSAGQADDSSFGNRSLAEEDQNSSSYDELMTAIIAKHEISKSENLRLTTELSEARTSNLVLREERDTLTEQNRKSAEELQLLQDIMENLKSIREENVRLEDELSTIQKNCQAHLLEIQSTANENMELKNTVNQKEDEIVKIADDLAAAHAEVISSVDKESKAMQLAKRYKESCKVHTARIEKLEELIAAQPLPDRLAQEPRDHIRGRKRPPAASGSIGVVDSNSVSKRKRSAEKTFQAVFESALVVEYADPTTTSKRKIPNVAYSEGLDVNMFEIQVLNEQEPEEIVEDGDPLG